jgi:hypothetical protein
VGRVRPSASTRPSSRAFELDRLDVQLTGTIGLVAVPVLDHELGHLAVDEELERLVAHLLAHDGVDAHGGEPSPWVSTGVRTRRQFWRAWHE